MWVATSLVLLLLAAAKDPGQLPHNLKDIGFMNNRKIEAADTECHIDRSCTPDDSELVRELNVYRMIDRTIHRQEFDPKNLVRCWEKCMENSCYYSRRKAAEAFNQQNYWKKQKIAIIPMKFSVGYPKTFYYQAAVLVHIYTDGSVLVAHDGVELGQSMNTKMIQMREVASCELNVPMSYIHIGEMNTVTVPNTIATAASTDVDVNGKAVQNIRTDTVIDASSSINPAVDIEQIEGTFIQGLGLYTQEELKYSSEGVLHTCGPEQYKIPSVTDIPEELRMSLLSPTPNPKAIYSSKGLGESGMLLESSAFFAITVAVAAARRERGLPLTLTMDSPAVAERIGMACVDWFTDLILQTYSKCREPWSVPIA